MLTRALHRTSRGAARQTLPSRLLEGLPEELLEREDASAPATTDAVAAHVARVRSLLGRPAE